MLIGFDIIEIYLVYACNWEIIWFLLFNWLGFARAKFVELFCSAEISFFDKKKVTFLNENVV